MRRSVPFILAMTVAAAVFGESRLKIVAGGWDVGSATPEKLLAHAELFDRTPFDGVSLGFKHVKGEDGKDHNYTWGLMSEPIAYRSEKREFDVAIARHAVAESKLLSPENRGKYRAQTSFSAGHYPDGFLLKPGDAYYNATAAGETPFGTFAKRLRDAARTGDEYLWIWGEKHAYVKWDPPAISHRNTRCVDRAGKYFLEYAG